jgi:dCTP deaminase
LILPDWDIRAAIELGELVIEPPPADDCFQPASVELTLGSRFIAPSRGYDSRLPTGGLQYIQRGDFVLASTVESVKIPHHMVAQVNGKSSLARLGLVVHQTAGFIDPGFQGQITLELSNVSPEPVKLTVGMKICQLVFMYCSRPVERPYGHPELGSHYQGQSGPTRSATAV